jgi:hypothetical protein
MAVLCCVLGQVGRRSSRALVLGDQALEVRRDADGLQRLDVRRQKSGAVTACVAALVERAQPAQLVAVTPVDIETRPELALGFAAQPADARDRTALPRTAHP